MGSAQSSQGNPLLGMHQMMQNPNQYSQGQRNQGQIQGMSQPQGQSGMGQYGSGQGQPQGQSGMGMNQSGQPQGQYGSSQGQSGMGMNQAGQPQGQSGMGQYGSGQNQYGQGQSGMGMGQPQGQSGMGQASNRPLGQIQITNPKPYAQLSNASPSELNPGYIKWKINATYSGYMNARKFFHWKAASGGNTTDWKNYRNWKKNNWDKLAGKSFYDDFQNWKNKFDHEDMMKWREFMDWQRIKDKECQEKDKEYDDKKYRKRREEYQKFMRKAKIKVYAKFHKFMDWLDHCQRNTMDHNRLSDYYKWSDKYVYDNPSVISSYKKWKKSECGDKEFNLWLKWMYFQKMREKAASLSVSGTENPDWSRNRNYGKYRKYYGRRYDDYEGSGGDGSY